MARKRSGLVPIGEVFSDLSGPQSQLSAIAQQSRISMAWLVRQALIEFFARNHGERRRRHRPRKNLFLSGQDGPR